MFMKFFTQYGRALLLAAVAVFTAVIFCGTAFAQKKPKAAVYIMGNPEGRDALRMAVNTFLVKSGRYQMIAVDAIDLVAQEHQRQMSGSVSDDQIARLGFDAGAQYVCVVERTELDGVSYVATRMVSVESKVAEFADMVKLPQGGDIIEFIKWQVGSMLGIEVGAQPNSAAQTSSASVSNTSSVKQPVNQVTAPTNQPSGIDGSSILTDSRNGKRYRTVVIGGKRWMAENLNIETANSHCYKDSPDSCAKYGRLYTWNAAMTACPSGWHLPSRDEWVTLAMAVGGTGNYGSSGTAGRALKSSSGWTDLHGNISDKGNDEYGFSALPGGLRSYSSFNGGYFFEIGSYGYWWTATKGNGGFNFNRRMNYASDNVGESGDNTRYGYSVRCVMD